MADELQNIKDLEAQLIISLEQEQKILADDGRNPYQNIVDKYAVGASLYSDPERLQKMIDELKAALKRTLKNARTTGRVLGKNAIEKFLEKSEIRDRTQKALRIINNMNERRAAKRTQLALLELQNKVGVLKSDIAEFKLNSNIAGFTKKETLSQLVFEGKEKAGIAQEFAKKAKRVAVDAVRRERSAAEIDEYRKIAKQNQLWQWIAVSTKPCPDCDARAGRTLPIEQWERMGLPGSGRTICGRACKCLLMPDNVADERFPNTKAMTFDSKNLVLTTASEERTLKSKKATGR